MKNIFTQKFKIKPDVLSQEVNGETVILELESENYFGLDKIGTRIWQLMQEHDDLSSIYKIMLMEYDVDEDLLKGDMEKIISNFVDSGIVELNN